MAIRPPTVPAGTARLRVTFSAAHEEAQVDALVSALAQALKRMNIPDPRADSLRSIAAPWRTPSIAPAPVTTPRRRCRSACATSCVTRLDELKITPALDPRSRRGHGPWIARAQAPLSARAGGRGGHRARHARACARRQSRWLRRFARVRADAYSLPFRDGAFDLVFSSLMLQWCDDLDAVFAEIARVLRPGGLLLFSTFGPGTLAELREAWARERRRQQSRESFLRRARARQRAHARGPGRAGARCRSHRRWVIRTR